MIDDKLKSKDVENGETISPDELSDIYKYAIEDVCAKLKISMKTRGKTGEIEDYLESRRPFTHNI